MSLARERAAVQARYVVSPRSIRESLHPGYCFFFRLGEVTLATRRFGGCKRGTLEAGWCSASPGDMSAPDGHTPENISSR